eukprot:2423772-Pleurochrysis_carterae.AAC.1
MGEGKPAAAVYSRRADHLTSWAPYWPALWAHQQANTQTQQWRNSFRLSAVCRIRCTFVTISLAESASTCVPGS